MEESIRKQIADAFGMGATDPKKYSSLGLAYIGDGVYDLIIRTLILEQGTGKVKQFHRTASSIVKADAQKELVCAIEDMFTEEETAVFKRGRNAKSATSAKNASIGTYRIATGFEALLGYLYLKDDMERILQLVREGLVRTRQIEQLQGRGVCWENKGS